MWFCFRLAAGQHGALRRPGLLNEYLVLLVDGPRHGRRHGDPAAEPAVDGERLEHDLRERVVFAISGKSKGLVSGFERAPATR